MVIEATGAADDPPPYERTSKAHPYWLSTIQEFLLPDVDLDKLPHSGKASLLAAIEAVRQGDVAAAAVHTEASLPFIPVDSPVNAFAYALRGLCHARNGLRGEAVASLRKALEYLPEDARLTYSLGFTLLRQNDIAEAMDCFRRSVAIAPDLGPAWAALALISCLEQDHAATETAAREALRLGCPLPGGLVELALMQATRLQGKTAEGAFDFSSLALSDDEIDGLLRRLLATMPPIDPASLRHPPHGRTVYFVYADHLYVVEHVIPLVLSIAETGSRCAIHLHVANPGRGLAGLIERLRSCLDDVPLIVSTESVFVEQFAPPSIYHSCMRFVRFWQTFTANAVPMVMLDADSLARRDPESLNMGIDPAADVVLAKSHADPYWSLFFGGYTALRPTAKAALFIGRVAAFVLDNFARRTARWFLDQTALAACHDLLGARVSFAYLPGSELCGGHTFTDDQVFWMAVNEAKFADNPYVQFKERVRSCHGFSRAVNNEAYRPNLIDREGGRFLINAADERIAGEVAGGRTRLQPEVELLTGLVREGHTVVDIGAGFGATTVPFARAAGPHGRVFAYEADRLDFQILAANLAMAASTNTFLSDGMPRLDSIHLDACHLIRIGGRTDRIAALTGCRRVVARHHPCVYVADAGGVPRNAFAPLRDAGYTLYVHVVDESCVGVLGLPSESRLNVNGMPRMDS